MRSVRAGVAALVAVLLVSPAARELSSRLPGEHDYPSADRGIWTAEREALLRKKAAERRADTADVVDVITFLQYWDRSLEALSLARDAVAAQPSRIHDIARAVGSMSTSRSFRDPSSGAREAFASLIADMRARLRNLPREDAARAMRATLDIEGGSSDARTTRLRAFIDEYSGTAEAALAEVDLVASTNPSLLDLYLREHPRTAPGAKALYQIGSSLANVATNARGKDDPTPIFLKLLDIIAELESGQFPPCEWVERAPSLVTSFFVYQPRYSPENLDRMIDAYTQFISKHLVVDEASPLGNASGYLITSRMAELFEMKKDPAGIDRTWTTLERTVRDRDAVKFLRALYDSSYRKGKAPDAERPALVVQSSRTLADLADTGRGPWPERALATLAAQQFAHKNFANAIVSYRRYLKAYPQSDWAWVAAVRIGQSQAALGDGPSARASLRAVASTYPSRQIAQVVSLTLSSEASASIGDFAGQQADLSGAIQAWDSDFGPDLRFALARPLAVTQEMRPAFERSRLLTRRDALEASLVRPGGTTLETARWRVQQFDWNGAITILEPLLRIPDRWRTTRAYSSIAHGSSARSRWPTCRRRWRTKLAPIAS